MTNKVSTLAALIFSALLLLPDLAAPAEDPGLKVNIILWTSGRCAWFSWMGQQQYKLKLIVDYRDGGQDRTATFQHGLAGDTSTIEFYVRQDGGWENKPPATDGTRAGHRFNFFAKYGVNRRGFFKSDISGIPPTATITKATLWHHIHDSEGLKYDEALAGNYCEWSVCTKDWNWEYMTWNQYDQGRNWDTPGGDRGALITRKDRQVDLAEEGYHKNGDRNYPLDITAHVQGLQQARVDAMGGTAFEKRLQEEAGGMVSISPNPFKPATVIRVLGNQSEVKPEIAIYNVDGALVEAIAADVPSVNSGIVWHASGLPSGIYLVKVMVKNRTVVKKIVFQK